MFSWVALVALLGTGCSSFNREWKAAAAALPPANEITGRWQGTWSSQQNGHTDKLRCLIVKQGDDVYQARFQAKYRKYLSFGYTVPLHAKHVAVFQFEGEADLGWLAGGLYHYAGKASPTDFFSTYQCKRDHGVFQMTRP